ncbi:MAG: MBL fold metallo-hydrolase [Dehalococcoidia bacterium]|nr:MBL fold metallo-hydrolase [Dehalococcoidia bacterium]MDW8120324.1 MBL fold metallo-hydrolase [Chloroflexota bacterium]
MRLRFLGAHQSEAGPHRPMSILVDTTLALDAGGLTGALTLPEQARLQALLLTHRHYDHIRDIPLLGLNILERGAPLFIYGLPDTLEHLRRYLLDGTLYVDFSRRPSPEAPLVRLVPVEPLHPFSLQGYQVRAVPVPHSVPSVGWELTTPEGKVVFYTGDCGPQVSTAWEHTRPDLLVIETTMPDRLLGRATAAGHLTPSTMAQAVEALLRRRDTPLRLVVAHINPGVRDEVIREVHQRLGPLGITFHIGVEGWQTEV